MAKKVIWRKRPWWERRPLPPLAPLPKAAPQQGPEELIVEVKCWGPGCKRTGHNYQRLADRGWFCGPSCQRERYGDNE